MSSSDRPFERVLIIMFENMYRSYVLQNPYMRELAREGIEFVHAFGAVHPSQPNYIAAIAGERCGVDNDDAPSALLEQGCIVDLLEDAGLSWSAYMQSYEPAAQPWTPELQPADHSPYVVKHNPFARFESVVRRRERWQRIATEADLFADLLNHRLPAYAWFSPNLWNDGHFVDGTQHEPEDGRAPQLVDQLARWLEGFFAKLRFPGPDSHLPPGTLVVVTFDEADYEADYEATVRQGPCESTYDGPNQIYTVLLGDDLEPRQDFEPVNHYTLLRTLERNWNLGSLGKNDAGANCYRCLWGEQLVLRARRETPLVAGRERVVVGARGRLLVIERDDAGRVSERSFDGHAWTDARHLGARAGSGLACWSAGEELLLAHRGPDGALSLRRRGATAWDEVAGAAASDHPEPIAGAAFPDGRRSLLVYRSSEGLFSRTLSAEGWDEDGPVELPVAPDSSLALGRLGASFYLIEHRASSKLMLVWSYNTAEFNALEPDPPDPASATTVGQWAPCAFPVADFSVRPDPYTPGEPEPATRPEYFLGEGPMACVELEGALHLFFVGAAGLRESHLALAGLLTPKHPVSYQASKLPRSNGYGTLAQAGWTPQRELGPSPASDRPLHAARLGRRALVLSETPAGAVVLDELSWVGAEGSTPPA